MNAATTTAQFLADAPASFRFRGRTYKHSGNLFGGHSITDADHARFDFTARKARGAIMGSKVSFVVTYDGDLYNVDVIAFDGQTFDTETIATVEGVYCDGFAAIIAVHCR